MSYTSINISNSDNNFKYIIEYNQDEFNKSQMHKYVCCDNDHIHIFENGTQQVYKNNSIINIDNDVTKLTDEWLPTDINTSKINLYFPEFSVDTYERGVKYIFTINTWINNKIIYLGSYIISRQDCVAVDEIRSFYNEKYYEMLSFDIVDPYDLIFNGDFEAFRVNKCSSKVINSKELNNNSSILNFTLHPIIEIDENNYVLMSDYIGGQNAINLKQGVDNNLRYLIETNYTETGICFNSKLLFNDVYSKDIGGLLKYIQETYNPDIPDTSKVSIRLNFYIQDSQNLYNEYEYELSSSIEFSLNKVLLNEPNALNIKSWKDYVEGMYLNSTATILIDGKELLTIMSNNILLTQDVFKYMIETTIDYVELNDINMNVYNLNVVNKIQKNIIQLDRPKDYKSNIIKPVYYRTRDLNNIIIHPSITENICLNLDKYKYLADSFILRIEGVNFTELSRTSNGVIFKVFGNKLPNSVQNGTYYILNQDSELISTGKYTYEV